MRRKKLIAALAGKGTLFLLEDKEVTCEYHINEWQGLVQAAGTTPLGFKSYRGALSTEITSLLVVDQEYVLRLEDGSRLKVLVKGISFDLGARRNRYKIQGQRGLSVPDR